MFKESDFSLWSGRIDSNTNPESFRYHQVIRPSTVEQLTSMKAAPITLIGFECDEGVRRNKGRTGARKGPAEIRRQLAGLPWRADTTDLFDMGTVACEGTALEDAQQELGDRVSDLLSAGSRCVIAGGGHETLYGHYLGVRKQAGPDAVIGLVNIDAHFDLREYSDQPSSGTMFKQILDSDPNARYFVCGIQEYGNTTELFTRADELGVTYMLEEETTPEACRRPLDQFMAGCDVVLLTLCMDVLQAADAPGVSAPSVFGLDPKTVKSLVKMICAHPKTGSFSLCETNPELDEDNRTAKLAAYMMNEAIMAFKKGGHL
ncbi:formimidoylglutamase [Edaphobacillus lindanitolerans]|uniref:Formimidoylglutamase n=1 Tax=Edaphobacillus lindanitolerans TaxID=550447 RepID=A0A1U7PP35_9BACI|nr:formimidoylglutamase [Edaphobacillus lindanitolerans]SIT75399.1 formiminoglutamase [Edaphobacillus lindanitolerans]